MTMLFRNRLNHTLQSASSNSSGSVALIFALVFPVLLLITAGAVDFGAAVRQKSNLQRAVDAAALAAASELSLSNSKTSNVNGVIQTLVESYVKAAQANKQFPSVMVSTIVHTSPLQVEVNASQSFQSIFGDAFGLQVKDFKVRTVAQVIGQPNICVLVLHPSTNGALSLEQKALVTGDNCAVYSNSTHNIGIKSKSSAVLKASTICSAGGIQGGGKNFDPPPYMDCPTFEDPLRDRPEPTSGTCVDVKPTSITTSQRLQPGTYCGLSISGGANVELSPGTYVIKNGPMLVNGGASITGKGVGIFLTGKGAYVDFAGDSIISLEAPTTGPMTGLLIFAARQAASGAQHRIYSENAQVMVGTVYIPTGELRIDGSADVGSKSAYTAIVAQTVRLYGGPHIILNTNYSETDVPVPDGIKGAGQPIKIIE